MNQVAREGCLSPVNCRQQADRADGVTWRGVDQKLVGPPAKGLVVAQHVRHWQVVRNREKIVSHMIEVEHAPVAPEILGVLKQVAFVGGHVNRDPFLDRAGITLALVAVMMRVQDGVNLGDANLAEQVQDMA